MRIAIVGSGVSGLVAAHHLWRRHEVHVFEAADRVGGHTHTVDVELVLRAGEVERHAVDTGFIVYNEKTYPHFTRLLAQLGVATQPTDMSFSVADERTGLEYGTRGLAGLFAQRRNWLRPGFHRTLREILRFNREALAALEDGDERTTLGDHLARAGFSRAFVEQYVIPMGAAIWSASPGEFLRIPLRTFVSFFENHGLLDHRDSIPWRVVKGGSRRYVEALTAPFRDRIRTGCPVRAIRREPGGVWLATPQGDARFDRVVLALHSDQALKLLQDPSDLEWKILSAIRYQENDAVLHTDASVMPRARRAWASWNYRVPREACGRAFVSYHMNRLQGLRSERDVFVTLNGQTPIAREHVLARETYHHPILDARAVEAQRSHGLVDGVRRTHYCGAYWGYGFHEDGVRSALRVAGRLAAAS